MNSDLIQTIGIVAASITACYLVYLFIKNLIKVAIVAAIITVAFGVYNYKTTGNPLPHVLQTKLDDTIDDTKDSLDRIGKDVTKSVSNSVNQQVEKVIKLTPSKETALKLVKQAR